MSKRVTNYDRMEFVDKLVEAMRGDNGLLVTEWENRFIGSYRSSSGTPGWFTEARAMSTDLMWKRYGAEIGMPWPEDHVDGSVKRVIPEAVAGGCMYLVKGDDGRQRPCNEPAVLMRLNGFRYCQACADKAAEACRRHHQKITLVKFKNVI